MEKTILVIFPGRDVYHDAVFNLLVAETGESLASHFCSNYTFAYGDLYEGRPERIEEWQRRFGDFEVKYIDETDISNEELLRRNKEWFTSLTKEGGPQDPTTPSSEELLKEEIEKLKAKITELTSDTLVDMYMKACDDRDDFKEQLDKARADKSADWVPFSPVSERLPEPGEYLCYNADNDYPFVSYYDGSSWGHSSIVPDYVTHWMPLPSPPEVK